jgi:vacuolar-type H+-ATPase subunit H
MGASGLMVRPRKQVIELSPLDQIRRTEAENTRGIAVAREAAELTVGKEKTRAKELFRKIREVGRRDGQTRYKEILSEAEDKAGLIVAQAQNEAEELHRKGQLCMNTAVCDAVNIIIGLDEMVKDE